MKKIVYTPGVWDIIHVGHLNVLKRAKLCGDYLIVGVCSDRLVVEHKKQAPTINQQQRAEIIGALKYVDEVYIYDNPDQSSQLKLFNVSVFVIGEQFGSQGVPEHANALDYCTKNNIPVVRIDRYPDLSSSIIKNRNIKSFWSDRAKKAKDNELGLWQSTSLTDSEEKATIRLNLELKYILDALGLVPKKSSLLDLGCGVGRLTNEVARGFEKVYAYDYVKEFIELAKTKTDQRNITFVC
jgi:glycerol-3-phosphate cytidylyltransferase